MRRLWLVTFLSAVALLLPVRATADLQVITGANYGPGVFNPMAIQPFDPALGTLDSVNVTITGQITATVAQFPCGEPSPALCPFELILGQNFFGLNPSFFSFATHAQFVFAGTDPQLIQGYSYSFTFDALADLLGFTFPNFSPLGGGNATQMIPPVDINGTRASFLPTLVGLNEIDDVLTVDAVSGAAVTSYSDVGGLIVQYNYTPAPTPEPGTLLLIASGLGLLMGRRGWRRTRNSPTT